MSSFAEFTNNYLGNSSNSSAKSKKKMTFGELTNNFLAQKESRTDYGVTKYNELVSAYRQATDSASKDNDKWHEKSYYSNQSDYLKSLENKKKELENYFKNNGQKYSKDFLAQMNENLKNLSVMGTSLQEANASTGNFYSQWEDENSYNNWVSAEKTKKEQLELDLPTAQKEIDEMQKRASFLDDQIKGLKANQKLSNISVVGPGQAKLYDPYAVKTNANNSELLSKYQEEYEQLSQDLAKKKQYVSVAERLQSNAKFVNDAKNAEDFEKLSIKGLNLLESSQNTPSEENTRDVALRMSGSAASLITSQLNDWIYSTTGEGATADSKAKFEVLTDDERKVYAYYLGKGDTESAKSYLESMEDTLNQRVASGVYEKEYKDNVVSELLFGVKAGLNQNLEGMTGFAKQFSGNDEYQAPSGTDYVSAFIRDDLSEKGAVHQGAYDLITTTSNMMPSILTSTLIGTVAPVLGQVVGAGMMGMSASGSAYQEMINLGYNKEQAQTYGKLVGASEAGLGLLLGGISKLGGAVGTKAIPKALATKFASAADTAIGNLAIRYGSSMLSEFSEEALQEILDPVFQNIAVGYNLNDLSDIELSEVLYSGLLGALSAGLLEGVSITADTVNTARVGSSIKNAGNIESLKELGSTLSADSVAYRIANKVNEKSSAYTIGKLFNEVGATLNEGNIASLKSNLVSRGMTENDAQVLAEAYAYGVVNDTVMLTPAQEEVFKNNEVLATAVHEELIAKNNTYNQQVQRFFEISDSLNSKKVAKPTQKSTKPTTESVDGVNADTFEGATENTVENDFKQTTYNGEAVSFKYKSADAVELDNGETVSVEDITMSDDDAVFYDAIMGENDIFPEGRFVNGKLTSGVNISTANEIRKIFGGTPTINQLKGVQMYYNYGMYNIKRFGESGALTEAQERQVFNLGRALSESVAEKESSTPKVKKYSKGKVKYNVKSELSSRQQASVEVIEKLADMFNITFNLYESTLNENGERLSVMPNGKKTSANGYYMNGEIYVDINAGNNGQGAVLYTVAHELTHYIREWSPKKFKVLADFLVEQYESKGKSVDYYVNKQMEKARKSGNKNMKYSEAFEEFVADSMEKMLTDQNAVEKLAMLRTKDKSVFDKLREGIQKLVDRIKQEYAKLTPDSAEGRTVATMTDVLSDIQDLFLEALDDASNNFQKTEKNTIINDSVKKSERFEEDRYYSRQIEKWDSLKDNAYITVGNIVENSPLNLVGMPSGKLYFDVSKIKGVLENHNDHLTPDILRQIPKLLSNPIAITEFRPGQNYNTISVYGELYYNGVPIVVGVMAKQGRGGNIISRIRTVHARRDLENQITDDSILYLSENKKETDKWFQAQGHHVPMRGTKYGLIRSITFSNEKVNENVVKNSHRDSNGRELSAEVAEYFKDSKARDKDGNLLVLYHQTDGYFTVFDTHRQGAGSADNETPYGVFLKSNSKDIGLKGKNQIPLYANITNPLVAENRQELVYKISQLSVEYLKLHNRRQEIDTEYSAKNEKARNELRDFIVKWREQNKDVDSRILYDSNEFNELFDAEDSILEEWTAEVEKVSAEGKRVLTEALKTNGYDGVILHNDIGSFGRSTDAYIALESNQVKYIDNVNPTSNDDIRFSERSQSVYKLLGENQRLQKENERLKEKVKYLNDFVKLQRKITHGKIIDRRSTEAQARKLKKSTGSKIELSNLTDQLYAFYTLIIGSEDLVWDTVFTRASWIANDILNEIPESTQRDEYAQEILSYIRSKNIRLNDVQRAEVENIYDSYNAYRKRLMGSVTISQNGTSLDSVWQDLAEQYPDTFSKDTNPADMPLELADIIHTLRNSYEIIEEFDKTEQVRWLAEQIYDTYWDVSTVESVMDKLSKEHQQQINELKTQHAERVKKIYAKHQEDLKDQKAYYQEMYKRLRERATASHKKQMLDYQDKVHEAQAKAIEKRNNTARRQQVLKFKNSLETRLLKDHKEKNIPLELQPWVCDFLIGINFDNVGAENRLKNIEDEMSKTKNPQALNELQGRYDRIKQRGEKEADELHAKKGQYMAKRKEAIEDIRVAGLSGLVDDNELVYELNQSINQEIRNTLAELRNEYGTKSMRDLSTYELECLYQSMKIVDAYIRSQKEVFIDGKKQETETVANNVANEVLVYSKNKLVSTNVAKLKEMGWTVLKPKTAFDLVGSETLVKILDSIRDGENKFATNISNAQQFYLDTFKKHNADKWDFEEEFTFNIEGEKVTLTLGEIMSMYNYSKREQAIPHLTGGGFTQVRPATKKKLKLFKVEYEITRDHGVRASEAEIGAIINSLSAEQKKFCDDLQEYLSTVMGALGNEVSRELYQINLYKEKYYWPLKSSSDFQRIHVQENEKVLKLRKNEGFSNATVKKANNPVVLESVEKVFADHVVHMSGYNAYTIGAETMRRVFGYVSFEYSSVRAVVGKVYGKGAVDYLNHFIQDLNGGRNKADSMWLPTNLVSTFKKVTVGASMSTVVQQPTALIRAMALIKPKHFGKSKVDSNSLKTNWEELKKYAPVAVMKEIGGYDMSVGVNVAEFVTQKEYSTIKEKGKALITDKRYRDELAMWGAAKADELSWATLWRAVKNEQHYRFPNMEKEKFLKICGKRFTDIVYQTQVYDSIFSRAEIMRSTSEFNKMATSFMGEPLTSLNILVDSILQVKRGKITTTQAKWNISTVVFSQIVAAAMASVIYAMRDDDEDESYWEKYVSSFSGNVVDQINPLTWVPYLRDVYSKIRGYSVERTDMAVISDLITSVTDIWHNDKITPYEKTKHILLNTANCFGIPAKNVNRELNALTNMYKMLVDNNVAQKGDTAKAFAEGIFGEKKMSDANEYLSKGKTDKANKLISDLLEEKIKKNISNGKTPEKAEKDAKSSIRSSLTSYWKPLFIKAYQEDDYIEQEEIYERLLSTGIYGTSEDLRETITKWVKDLQE